VKSTSSRSQFKEIRIAPPVFCRSKFGSSKLI
jgi:hypothetical protein